MIGASEKKLIDCNNSIKNTATSIRNLPGVYWKAMGLIWRSDPKGILVFFFLIGIAASLAPAQLYISKHIIDGIKDMASSKWSSVLGSVLGLITLQVLAWLLISAGQQYLDSLRDVQGSRLEYYISRLILQKATKLDMAFYESKDFFDKFDFVHRQSAGEARQFLMFFSSFLRGFLTLISYLIILYHLHPLVVVILIGLSPGYLFYHSVFAARRFQNQLKHISGWRKLKYLEMLLGSRDSSREVRLFGLEDILFQRFDHHWSQFIAEEAALVNAQRGAQIVLLLFALGATGAVWLYAIHQMVAGYITLGAMIMYFTAAKAATDSMDFVFGTGGRVFQTGLSFGSLFSFLDMKPDAVAGTLRKGSGKAPLQAPKRLLQGIEFCNVSFHYPGTTTHVLRNVSFSIRPGEHVAIVGCNGAGKTTVVKLLTRLFDPTEGTILLEGQRLEEYPLEEMRKVMGVLLQDFIRFQFSVSDNIGFGCVPQMENVNRLKRAAKLAGCLPLIESLPEEFNTKLGRTFSEGVDLSGGEWQKLALARAFMRDASILILDEPTASLDPLSELELCQSIRRNMSDKTCIFVSHRLSLARFMDRILVFKDGTILEQGHHCELISQGGLYSQMHLAQSSRNNQPPSHLAIS